MRRPILVVLVILVLAALAGGGAWLWLRSADPRERLAAILGESLGRPVEIGALQVDGDGTVGLRDVVVGNAEGWDGAPLFRAGSIDIDVALEQLLDRELVGQVEAHAIDLHVIKRDGRLNLAGLVPARGGGGAPIDLHLDLAIHAATVTLDDLDRDEHLVLEGVDVRVLLSNRDGARRAEAEVEISRMELHGLALEQLEFTARVDDAEVVLSGLHARLGEHGRIDGAGQLFLHGERGWSFVLDASDVDLDGDVRRIVQALYPPIAAGADAVGASGRVAAHVELGGSGLHWDRIRPSLAGSGRLTLLDLRLPASSLLLEVVALAGRPPGPFSLASLAIEFTIAEGWIGLGQVSATDGALVLPIRGRVSLAGELDLSVDLMPAVRAFGGGAYAGLARVTTSIPVRVEGTLSAPKLAPPSARDVGVGLLGGALRRALGPGQPDAP